MRFIAATSIIALSAATVEYIDVRLPEAYTDGSDESCVYWIKPLNMSHSSYEWCGLTYPWTADREVGESDYDGMWFYDGVWVQRKGNWCSYDKNSNEKYFWCKPEYELDDSYYFKVGHECWFDNMSSGYWFNCEKP